MTNNPPRYFLLRCLKIAASIAVFVSVIGCETTGTSRHERHEEAITASAKPTQTIGSETFSTAQPYATTFDNVLTYLKKHDYTIESANQDVGQIVTAIAITGGWKQTGTRAQVTLLKEDSGTTVKVAVTEQQRFKAFQIEPWGEARLNREKSETLAADLKSAL